MIIKGKIKKVYYQKGNWGSLSIKDKSGDTVRASGRVLACKEGDIIEMEGDFEDKPPYGMQFTITSSKIQKDLSVDGIKKFLVSFVSGVGEKTADSIIEKFGADTYDIIKTQPGKLCEIKGISENKALKIQEAYLENTAYVEIMNYFNGDITENQALKIYQKYKADSMKVLEQNPYQLIYDIDGMGFKKVDKLALASGLAPDSRKRVGAAIIYTLKTLSENGDLFVRDDELEIKIKEVLTKECLDQKITINRLADEIIEQVNEEKLVCEPADNNGVNIYLKYLYEAEKNTSEIIRKMIKEGKEVNCQNVIADFERAENIEFDNIQKNAISMAVGNSFSVITGGPGMGKTTIIKAIIYVDVMINKSIPICLAPTGKAAKRMSESTGQNASTIDSFLMKNMINNKMQPNTLFIIDETSMIDMVKAFRLLREIDEAGARVVFVGDVFQLPSIGPGNFLRDLVACPLVPTTTLKYSYRFGGTIAKDAKLVNEGYNFGDLEFDENAEFVNSPKEYIMENIEKVFREESKKYDIKDILILAPMKNRSQSSTLEINNRIRDMVNPADYPVKKDFDFRVGDRVMNTVNNYRIDGINLNDGKVTTGIFNGDMGIVTKVNTYLSKVEVTFDDNRCFEFDKIHARSLTLAYAMTYHKAQGSEAKCVIVVINNEHLIMLNRNLFYTGITRAKEKLKIIGDVYAINTAIKNTAPITRNTLLSQRIMSAAD